MLSVWVREGGEGRVIEFFLAIICRGNGIDGAARLGTSTTTTTPKGAAIWPGAACVCAMGCGCGQQQQQQEEHA